MLKVAQGRRDSNALRLLLRLLVGVSSRRAYATGDASGVVITDRHGNIENYYALKNIDGERRV